MGKIFKQLTRHWAACLVVVALLIVQAYCDLSLPDYTSKIVDTGIQQGGIESPLPQTLRSSTLDALSLLMREEDAAAFENAYEYYVQDDGVLKLRSDLTADERAVLEETVTVPDIVLYMTVSQTANGTGMPAQSLTPLSEYPAASSGEEAASSAASATAESTDETETVAPTTDDLDAVCAQFAAMAQMPGFSREMIQQQLAGALAQMDEATLSSMASQATLLVSLEYEAQGVAHDVQMQYLFRVGGQMLGLTLLMVAVAILVGLIASRVSAASAATAPARACSPGWTKQATCRGRQWRPPARRSNAWRIPPAVKARKKCISLPPAPRATPPTTRISRRCSKRKPA